LVLLATLFVYFLDHTWPKQAVMWLRRLGGKLRLAFDSDGPYILLAGRSRCVGGSRCTGERLRAILSLDP